MHSFVSHYLAHKSASLENFCEAALNFSSNILSDIERYLPSGTAANYISKIRVLRDYVVDNELRHCQPKELVEMLSAAGIKNVNGVSRRKLHGYYPEGRSSYGRLQSLIGKLESLDHDDLVRVREEVDRLLDRYSACTG
jgi:hypothetical protein